MTSLVSAEVTARRRIRVVGVVQGVGFRPFVHRLACELQLAGLVGNDTDGVFIEVEGPERNVTLFATRLVSEAPPLARILETTSTRVAPLGGGGFRIVESVSGERVRTYVSPDMSVCDDCSTELFDSNDRRFRYPFINCTNCGPRFTIMRSLPYDRANTTMARFTMCPACASEYHDPTNRRFHAQPIACGVCGPQIQFEGAGSTILGTDAAIAATQAALMRGEIVAIKGIGGYHLACDATSDRAVEELRRRKRRAEKPLAIMVADLECARGVADIDSNAGALLASAARPIVLLDQRDHSGISHLVAPGSPYLGAMLAYTPLHQLLFRSVPDSRSPVPRALVLTSGNLSDEPICFDDDDARRRLGAMVDAWLVHDRPIHVPCDDSVMRVDGDQELPIRRSRGYAPLPIRLPIESEPLLATGGELKNTFCVASGRDAWMSQHIGDMGTIETLSAFERSRAQFGQMYRVTPTRVVSDAHPGYHVRQWAENVAATPITLVQHHHAHVASLMAEHGVPLGERITGVAFDGTGYGTDGAIWGGEILLAGYDDFERETHLSYVPLPGGDASIRKPFRAALAHLWAAGIEWSSDLAPVQHASPVELTALRRQLERNVQCVPTSSMGRLFDAVSSLLGVRHVVSYEAQAAIEMEALAKSPARGARRYEFEIVEGEFCAAPVLQRLVDDLRNGCARADIAAGFHQAVAGLIAEVADHVREKSGVACVGLSGGVFQNVLLVRLTRAALLERGLRVLTHRLVPPNDGGLALGQTAVASGVRASKGGAS